jgi:hypothetical protein
MIAKEHKRHMSADSERAPKQHSPTQHPRPQLAVHKKANSLNRELQVPIMIEYSVHSSDLGQ